MNILLVGPGALGCLMAFFIQRGLEAGERLTLLDYHQQRAERLSRDGIHYQSLETDERFEVTAFCRPEEVGTVDMVVFCVKSYDAENCLKTLAPILSQEPLLVFLQNGIGHLELETHGATPCFGTTTEGATLLGPGQVRHAGRGVTYLGFLEPPSAVMRQRLSQLTGILTRAGLNVQLSDNILARIWAKLFINAGINGLTAINDCCNGELLQLPGVSQQMATIVQEAATVARAYQIEIMDDPCKAAQIVCARTASNISSMLQDVRNRKKTEIDAINGAIVRLGRRLGVAAPENERIHQQVKALEDGYHER